MVKMYKIRAYHDEDHTILITVTTTVEIIATHIIHTFIHIIK